MRLFRRRERFDPALLHASAELVPRTERALVALAVHAQQLSDRVDRIEQRVEESEMVAVNVPSHEDLIGVRLHSAKVAAELTRVSVELRAEIERVACSVEHHNGHGHRVRALAESIIDLSDNLDTLPRDLA
jgi:hypothetical protein